MLHIEWPVLSQMVADVEPFDYERCGFFFGYEEGGDSVVTRIMPAKNSRQAERHTNYEIAAREYLCAEGMADEEGLKLLGVYHSHPNHPAIPSDFDQEVAQPNFFYIIISVKNRKLVEVRTWQLDQGKQFQEDEFDVIRSSQKYARPVLDIMELQ